jgi:hypothetical protein
MRGEFMQAHRIEAVIQQDGKLVIEDIPFHAGETVEIIILSAVKPQSEHRYPLRGTVIEYIDPTDPIASDDWEANG